MDFAERALLAREVYYSYCDNEEEYEEDFEDWGIYLAHLMGAILSGGQYQACTNEERRFVNTFSKFFDDDEDALRKYVTLVD